VRLLSAIGRPVDEPQVAAVEIAGEVTPAVRERVRHLVDERLDSLAPFLAELSRGRLRVY
jgi:S-adenosylmethionine synthetase